jgi:hypothetical protein
MPEDQLIALPPEVRTMVMTGANAMMNNAAANSGMMGSGVMMDMTMMGPMGMGMNGDMNMGAQLMQGMIPDHTQVQQSGVGIVPGNGTPEQVGNGIGIMQDGFNPSAGGGNMMNIGMSGGDFVIQVSSKFISPLENLSNSYCLGTKYSTADVSCYGGSDRCPCIGWSWYSSSIPKSWAISSTWIYGQRAWPGRLVWK